MNYNSKLVLKSIRTIRVLKSFGIVSCVQKSWWTNKEGYKR